MKLTESELRRLIVEELEDLQELDIIDEALIEDKPLQESKEALAAFLTSIMISNPVFANEARKAGVTSDLKDLGIDLAALASESPKEKAAKTDILKPKAGGPSVKSFKVDQPTGPMIQKVPEYEGVSIIAILNKIAQRGTGREILRNAGFVGAITGTDPKLQLKFDTLKAKNKPLIDQAVNAIKSVPKAPTQSVKPAASRAVEPKGGVKIKKEAMDVPPEPSEPPAIYAKAPETAQPPFSIANYQTAKMISPEETKEFLAALAGSKGAFLPQMESYLKQVKDPAVLSIMNKMKDQAKFFDKSKYTLSGEQESRELNNLAGTPDGKKAYNLWKEFINQVFGREVFKVQK